MGIESKFTFKYDDYDDEDDEEKCYCNLVNIKQNLPACVLIHNGVKKV